MGIRTKINYKKLYLLAKIAVLLADRLSSHLLRATTDHSVRCATHIKLDMKESRSIQGGSVLAGCVKPLCCCVISAHELRLIERENL